MHSTEYPLVRQYFTENKKYLFYCLAQLCRTTKFMYWPFSGLLHLGSSGLVLSPHTQQDSVNVSSRPTSTHQSSFKYLHHYGTKGSLAKITW